MKLSPAAFIAKKKELVGVIQQLIDSVTKNKKDNILAEARVLYAEVKDDEDIVSLCVDRRIAEFAACQAALSKFLDELSRWAMCADATPMVQAVMKHRADFGDAKKSFEEVVAAMRQAKQDAKEKQVKVKRSHRYVQQKWHGDLKKRGIPSTLASSFTKTIFETQNSPWSESGFASDPTHPQCWWSSSSAPDWTVCTIFPRDCEAPIFQSLAISAAKNKDLLEQKAKDILIQQTADAASMPLFAYETDGETLACHFTLNENHFRQDGLGKPWLLSLFVHKWVSGFLCWPWLGVPCMIHAIDTPVLVHILGVGRLLAAGLANLDSLGAFFESQEEAAPAIFHDAPRFVLAKNMMLFVPAGFVPLAMALPVDSAAGENRRSCLLVQHIMDHRLMLKVDGAVRLEMGQSFDRNLAKYAKSRPWSVLLRPMQDWKEKWMPQAVGEAPVSTAVASAGVSAAAGDAEEVADNTS